MHEDIYIFWIDGVIEKLIKGVNYLLHAMSYAILRVHLGCMDFHWFLVNIGMNSCQVNLYNCPHSIYPEACTRRYLTSDCMRKVNRQSYMQLATMETYILQLQIYLGIHQQDKGCPGNHPSICRCSSRCCRWR
jgi:hypothetical protein